MTPTRPVNRVRAFRKALAEFPPLWWSLLYFFSLLCGYYVLRPVRDAMGASGDVAAVFPRWLVGWSSRLGIALDEYSLQLLFSVTFVVMVLLQPLYGALVSRFPRRVFLPLVYLLLIGSLVGFHWLFETGVSGRGAMFFVWVAVFNMFAVTVFWSFMADVFDNEHAKKMYGYIGAGGTLGALVGPGITRLLVEPLGVANLLLVSAGLMAVCLLCILKLRPWAMRRERRHGDASGEEAMGGSVWAGVRLVWQRPLLRALAALLFFGVGVGTLLYNEQAAIVREFYPGTEAATRYYAMIDWAVNGVTLLIQLLLTRWLLRRYGVAPVLLGPAIAILLGYCLLTASPLPMLVAIVQVVTRAGEFSLAKPGRETLYTRVDRESRYKAKAVIDTVIYRGADLTFVWLHKAVALLGSTMVFATGIAAAAAMTAAAWSVVRSQRELPDDPADPQPSR